MFSLVLRKMPRKSQCKKSPRNSLRQSPTLLWKVTPCCPHQKLQALTNYSESWSHIAFLSPVGHLDGALGRSRSSRPQNVLSINLKSTTGGSFRQQSISTSFSLTNTVKQRTGFWLQIRSQWDHRLGSAGIGWEALGSRGRGGGAPLWAAPRVSRRPPPASVWEANAHTPGINPALPDFSWWPVWRATGWCGHVCI